MDNLLLIEAISDSCRLLVDLQRDESLTGKSLIVTNINTTLKDILEECPIDGWLFEKDLEENLKAAKAIDRSSKDLKPPNKSTKPNPENLKGPSRQSNRKPYQYRMAQVGGQQRPRPNNYRRNQNNTYHYRKKPQ